MDNSALIVSYVTLATDINECNDDYYDEDINKNMQVKFPLIGFN